MYNLYPNKNIYHRLYCLNNRDLAIVIGVIIGMITGIYGIFWGTFTNTPVLGVAKGHGILFKIITIVLCGGVFGNILSYIGICIDIFTNHKTIFDLLKVKKLKE